MKTFYQIENCLIFDEDSQEIFIKDERENLLVLPAPSARLLSELIKTNGIMVSREWLLQRVWEQHGYRASNSNLNNYLSILRRNIAVLMPDAVFITTLPKQGIIFQAEVEEITVEETPPQAEPAALPALVAAANLRIKHRRWPRLAFSALIALAAGTVFAMQREPLSSLPLELAFSQAQCRFYSMENAALTAEEFHQLMEKFNFSVSCDQPRDVFLTRYDWPNKHRHMAFVAWCQRAVNGQYTHCENVKKILWERA